eukprot:363256-Chlamydomonas_euryale.AAC.11
MISVAISFFIYPRKRSSHQCQYCSGDVHVNEDAIHPGVRHFLLHNRFWWCLGWHADSTCCLRNKPGSGHRSRSRKSCPPTDRPRPAGQQGLQPHVNCCVASTVQSPPPHARGATSTPNDCSLC